MGWLSGWTYRKEITLSRASGAVTNYQMKLLVGESSGATGENVDCAAHCKTDFSDLRFTTSDGSTLLDYWIESVTGTTPNQLATVWIEFNSIGTGATTFYMYYGNSGASAYSNGANTFILFDDFERGSNGDNVGGIWTVSSGDVDISTESAWNGTRSGKWKGVNSTNTIAYASLSASSNEYEIRVRVNKENYSSGSAQIAFYHGNGSKCINVFIKNADLDYWDGTSAPIVATWGYGAWRQLWLNNIDFSTGKYDIFYEGSRVKDDAVMSTSGTSNGLLRIDNTYQTNDYDCYIDTVFVRNWRATEPAWGTWGVEENAPVYEAETFTITDVMGRAIEAERAIEETITFSDEMEPLHLVDANTEAVTLGDSFVADEMIRKKTRHPRLQGKHLSLKFSSSAHGSFAVYYLRAKVHKTIAVERRPLHPNLQGRHLSLKISHNAAAEFKAYYASAKMAATRGLSNSVHPNAQGSHIGLTIRHAAAEAFRMDYAAMRLLQVKR